MLLLEAKLRRQTLCNPVDTYIGKVRKILFGFPLKTQSRRWVFVALTGGNVALSSHQCLKTLAVDTSTACLIQAQSDFTLENPDSRCVVRNRSGLSWSQNRITSESSVPIKTSTWSQFSWCQVVENVSTTFYVPQIAGLKSCLSFLPQRSTTDTELRHKRKLNFDAQVGSNFGPSSLVPIDVEQLFHSKMK